MSKYRALIVEDDPRTVDLVVGVLASLDHEHDVATSHQEAMARIALCPYSYLLVDLEIPARSSADAPRIQDTENLLEKLAELYGSDAPPVIILSDRAAHGLELTVDMMRLAMALGRRGAMDVIAVPFPTAGRTLDRVIKKNLRIWRALRNQRAAEALAAPATPSAPATPTVAATTREAPEPLTVTAAAQLLMRDIPGLNLDRARARVSKAAGRDEFEHTGTFRARRIDPVSFDLWRLRQRDRDLDREEVDV